MSCCLGKSWTVSASENNQATEPSSTSFRMSYSRNWSLGQAELCLEQCHGIQRLVASLVLGGHWFTFLIFFCYLLMQVEQICFLKKIKTTQFCQFRFTDVSISKQKPLMVLKVTQHCCNLHNISHDVFILRS